MFGFQERRDFIKVAVKTVRAPMPRSKRAKQFQPFDALVGLREAIAAKERVTTPRKYLSEDAIAEINKTLNNLCKGQLVTVVYYGDYEQEYLQLTGQVFKIDPYWHTIQIGSISIDFSEIYELMTYRRTLWTHRDLTDFWMIGSATAKRLNKLGLFTMGDVARCSLTDEERLYKEFGKNAVYIIDQAWGWEPVDIPSIKAYKPESTSVSSGQVLTRPYTFDETKIIVREMIENVVLDLVDKGMMTDQIVLMVGYDIENITDPKRRAAYHGEIKTDHYGRQVPKHARGTANMGKHTSSTKLITDKTLELFERIVDKKLLTRRLTISANHLLFESEVDTSSAAEQLTLFDDPVEIEQRASRAERKTDAEGGHRYKETLRPQCDPQGNELSGRSNRQGT